jgi:hypothetical protein
MLRPAPGEPQPGIGQLLAIPNALQCPLHLTGGYDTGTARNS